MPPTRRLRWKKLLRNCSENIRMQPVALLFRNVGQFSEYARRKQGDFLRMVQEGMSRLNVAAPSTAEKPKRKRKAKRLVIRTSA